MESKEKLKVGEDENKKRDEAETNKEVHSMVVRMSEEGEREDVVMWKMRRRNKRREEQKSKDIREEIENKNKEKWMKSGEKNEMYV